jgi:pimeloyl-ACP methyl ester carboxylesterase
MTDVLTRRIEANGLSFLADGAGEGDDIVLLLHGFPESRFSWRFQLPPLADLGWRAIAPDLRGYGGSSRPAGKSSRPCPSRRLRYSRFRRCSNCDWRRCRVLVSPPLSSTQRASANLRCSN